jgi:hypothetical protein
LSIQYSDTLALQADVQSVPFRDPAASGPVQPLNGNVQFYVNNNPVGGPVSVNSLAPDTTGTAAGLMHAVASLTLPISQAPSTAAIVTGQFTSTIPSSEFYGNSTTDPAVSVPVVREEAIATYSGGTYFSTANSSSYTATVALSGTATDWNDGSRGDIRNAKVEFHRDSVSGALLGAANLPVGLVNASDTTVGIATTPSFSYALLGSEQNVNGASLSVYTVVQGYYLGSAGPDVVTITVPGTANVSGGGFVVLQSAAGQYAGDLGSKCNFGFTMKYNTSGKNLQGQLNIIVRKAGRIYQIKGNAIDSLATSGTDYPKQATIVTKANLTDITNPLSPVSLGGNLSLQIQMTDQALGGQTDQIGISLSSSTGGLLFSSKWDGTKTVQQTLGGGNISVR